MEGDVEQLVRFFGAACAGGGLDWFVCQYAERRVAVFRMGERRRVTEFDTTADGGGWRLAMCGGRRW